MTEKDLVQFEKIITNAVNGMGKSHIQEAVKLGVSDIQRQVDKNEGKLIALAKSHDDSKSDIHKLCDKLDKFVDTVNVDKLEIATKPCVSHQSQITMLKWTMGIGFSAVSIIGLYIKLA